MGSSFRALRLTKTDTGQACAIEDLTDADLMDGDVDIAVDYSTLNYKDGLAITGKAPIARVWPLIPGIDLAGRVEVSRHDAFKPGDRVVLNGWGVGEKHHGGLAQRARVQADWLIALPEAISTYDAMAIGTAGYTAMLCVMRLEDHGVAPGDGEILVTGAAGGVGSIAVAILSRLGYSVVASTGRKDAESDYLTQLGAARVIDRAEAAGSGKPLDKERWRAAIDCVGSQTLAQVLAQVRYDGVVAACGMAQGTDLPASVLPFILRGVTLAGVDSVMCPTARRRTAWERLASDLDLERLKSISRTAPLDEAQALAGDLLAGQIRGRVVIDVNA